MTPAQSLSERRARRFAELWGGIEEKIPRQAEHDWEWEIQLTLWCWIKFSDGVRPYLLKINGYAHCDFTRRIVQIADQVCAEVRE